ncbi:hypothetical protein HDV00_005261 [Rhizophlyctis rosea]|nr:hypothetical protein HDV00_005261 [Rhizophlyctis rosea]
MSRHSKNNTALAFFTYAEKQKLNYGTQKQRVGRDSMRNFDACFLCLQTARDPQACPSGHLACKECFFENILAQKKDIARQQKLAGAQQTEADKAQAAEEEARRQAEIEQFERTQMQFGSAGARRVAEVRRGQSRMSASAVSRKNMTLITGVGDEVKGSSPQREMGDGSPATSRDTASPVLIKKEDGSKGALPSFWVPSLTPAAAPDVIKKPKTETMCTASETQHPVTIRKLIPVKFTEAKGTKGEYVCPSCMKAFTNGSKIVVLKGCGHALCKECSSKFVKTSKKCFVCETKCHDKDIVTLKGDGTGFAGGGGKVATQKSTVAFQ